MVITLWPLPSKLDLSYAYRPMLRILHRPIPPPRERHSTNIGFPATRIVAEIKVQAWGFFSLNYNPHTFMKMLIIFAHLNVLEFFQRFGSLYRITAARIREQYT